MPRAAASAPSSMGSPRGVPVPWTATARTSRRGGGGGEELAEGLAEEEDEESEAAWNDLSASRRACLTSDDCAGPLGAVSDAEAPPWLTAEPRSRASKGGGDGDGDEEDARSAAAVAAVVAVAAVESPAPASFSPSVAVLIVLITITAKPSPRPYPSAEASKLLHLPCGDSACSRQMRAVVPRSSWALTPPATAREQEEEGEEALLPLSLPGKPDESAESSSFELLLKAAPLRLDLSSRAARCVATRLEEHATSVATQGPPNPNANETLPARNERPWPVIAAAAPSAQPRGRRTVSRYSEYMQPTKTPVAEEAELSTLPLPLLLTLLLLLLLLLSTAAMVSTPASTEQKPPPRRRSCRRCRSSSALVASSTPSSSSLACGSMAAASAGLIRNTEESKAARRSPEVSSSEGRNEPSLTYEVWGFPCGEYQEEEEASLPALATSTSPSASQRSKGTGEAVSAPEAKEEKNLLVEGEEEEVDDEEVENKDAFRGAGKSDHDAVMAIGAEAAAKPAAEEEEK